MTLLNWELNIEHCLLNILLIDVRYQHSVQTESIFVHRIFFYLCLRYKPGYRSPATGGRKESPDSAEQCTG